MDKHPDIRGHIPIYRELEPILLGSEPIRQSFRKIVRRLLATPVPLAALEKLASTLARVACPPSILESLYWKILGSYRLLGFHEGLKSLRKSRPAKIQERQGVTRS
jgi:hypothetical protein